MFHSLKYAILLLSLSQGFQRTREQGHKIIGNKMKITEAGNGNKSCGSEILVTREYQNRKKKTFRKQENTREIFGGNKESPPCLLQ